MSAIVKTSSGVIDFIQRWCLSGQVRFLHGAHSKCLLRIVIVSAVSVVYVVISFGVGYGVESSACDIIACEGKKNSCAIGRFHGQVSAVSVDPKIAIVGV